MRKEKVNSNHHRYLLFDIGLIFVLGLSGCSFFLKKEPDPLLQSDYLDHEIEYKDRDDQ